MFAFLLAICIVGQSDKSNARIKAVVDTLQDLLQSVENEATSESKSFKCFVDWCDHELENRRKGIENTELALDDLEVNIDQLESSVKKYEYALKQNQEDIEEIQDALAQAKNIREEEENTYNGDKALNQQSVGQLDQAIKQIEKVQAVGFLQANVRLQISSPGESNFVLGVFQSLKHNMVRNQEKADEVEAKKVESYNTLTDTKGTQLGLVQKDSGDKKMLSAEASQKLTDAKNDIKTNMDDLEAAKAGMKDVQVDCTDRQNSWTRRSEDRQKEIGAIHEAISYLNIAFQNSTDEQTPPTFFQMDAGLHRLQSMTSDLNSISNQVEQATKADQFASVKQVIDNLIGVLESEEKSEAEKKNWCKTEVAKNEKTNETKQHELKVIYATTNKTTALVQQLLTDAEAINGTLVAQGQAEEQAANLRKEQKKQYEKGAKDRALALRVLGEAKMVLQKFYESQKPALLQTGQAPMNEIEDAGPRPDLQQAERKTGEGNVVIVMLEKIADDIVREIHEADQEEKAAAEGFAKLIADNRREFDASMMEITEKVTRRAKLEVKLHAANEDKESLEDTITALGTQITATATDCTDALENFDERSKARNFEIDQLKDAKDILSGASMAVRTGFLQAEKSFESQTKNDATVRQLQMVARAVQKAITK